MNEYLLHQIADLQTRVVQAYSQDAKGKLSLKHALQIIDLMHKIAREVMK
jgi:hypothetical protein